MLTTSESSQDDEINRNDSSPSTRLEELLDRCRHAATLQEHESSWGALTAHVIIIVQMDGSENSVSSTVRQVLVEWPYNSVYSNYMDRFFDVSGAMVVVPTCCSLLKELGVMPSIKGDLRKLSGSKLPRSSILQVCWTTLQRLLLSKKENDQKITSKPPAITPPAADLDLERLVKLILSIPTLVANACHACELRLPLLATSTKFYPRLIDCSWSSSAGSTSDNTSEKDDYRIALLKAFLTSRNNAEPVAIGFATHHPLPALFSSSVSWSTREMNNLILALLQHCVVAESSDAEFTANVLTTCQNLLQPASVEQQEAVVHHIVLKSSTADIRLCSLFIGLLDQCEILLSSLCDVAEAWSRWSFCQDVPSHCQRYVSQMILEGLKRCAPLEAVGGEDPLTLNLLEGVTHRLESFVPEIRFDGMRVAQQVAQRMNQELHFDELAEAEEPTADAIIPTVGDEETNKKLAPKDPTKSSKRKTKKLPDPDADYDSDDDEDDDEVSQDDDPRVKTDTSTTEEDSDSSTVYDDELVPYSLEDEEEDLMVTAKPLHLLQALELLRTGENDEHAYSHHETAIRALPELIRKRPDNLPDVAISLLLQVLRMENKFGVEDFLQLRQQSLVALAVEQPVEIGQQLVEEIFKDGTLSDRLACFGALQEAAYELSGSKGLDQRAAPRGSDRKLIDESTASKDSELTNGPPTSVQAQVVRLQAKTKRKRSPRLVPTVIKNNFTSIAPMWFYGLLGQFLETRNNETLWSGSTGSQLLASLFRTLAVIVEFAGMPSGPVLAKDLMELVWSFVDADVAEVRMAVLISVGTSIAMLPEDRVLSILLEHGERLPAAITGMSRTDPDNKCRQLATTISQSIMSVLREIQGTLI